MVINNSYRFWIIIFIGWKSNEDEPAVCHSLSVPGCQANVPEGIDLHTVEHVISTALAGFNTQ